MSQGYLDYRFYLEEKLDNLLSYIHKSIPNYGVVVDTIRGIYTITMETPAYVKEHLNDFQWQILNG